MSLLLYAITDAELGRDPELRGIDGAALQAIEAGGLVAVASGHSTTPPLDEAILWRFEQVIESLMQHGAVLPVRFGTTMETTDAIVAMLQSGRPELVDKLDAVRGAVELSVRGIWRDSPGPASAGAALTGTDYMRDRLAPQLRAQALAAQLHAHLDGQARASRHRILARPAVPVSAAFLVARGTEDEFVRAVTRLDAQLDGADLVCTGPWPAYSFAGDALGD
ncbi:MAG: hypothetical protein QOF83_3536 [Solirubrobacteraceae bacterium]|jgi:hypothetical protein|nr:hypothetical protein [Solirubrobacteraceae bacterium]